jgi:hypothetical protein
MRSGGLVADDWAVITQYIDALKPLKHATKRLEGRGKSGRFGAIYKIIPVFEYLLGLLETIATPYEAVNFNASTNAPKDYLPINIKAAWRKANEYYTKLDDSPAYYAAVCLYPYYKYYCNNSWRTKARWLDAANAGFQQLWAEYKPLELLQRRSKASTLSSINEAINAHVEVRSGNVNSLDEFDCWKKYEPK